MRLYILILFSVFALTFTSCEDNLETFPTDQASGAELFSDVDKAMATVNGIYRSMYMSGWGDGWYHEQFGHISVIHSGSLMGEDMNQNEQGQGWFYYDYKYQVKSDYTNKAGRPYSTWNFYYKIITNVNSILASRDVIAGTPSKINSLMGQAFALRAFCYFNLARFYQQTYVGNEDKPGVPIYTEPTTTSTKGVGRGKLSDVYALINKDIDSAVVRLDVEKAAAKEHISNIDYYSACGLKARIKLEQGLYQEAYNAATAALSGNTTLLPYANIKDGYAFNDVTNKCVMWGFEMVDDQVPEAGRAGIFAHLDAEPEGFYANKSRVCVSSWLYTQLDDDDIRKNWWRDDILDDQEEPTGTQIDYCQLKFKFKNATTGAGDYVFMRNAEMMLIQAEAKCMLGEYGSARTILKTLMAERDPNYNIDALTDANTLTVNDSNGPTTPLSGSITLLDEIILQRRIELWGETSRIYDIKRLKTGFTRNFAGSNHSEKISSISTEDPECPDFVMSIPQVEFDGNPAMDAETDQNPW